MALHQLQEQESDPNRSVLLAGGHVVSMHPAVGDLTGDVLLVGGRIQEIGRGLADRVGDDVVVVDVTGCAVLPGLVDSHVHAWAGAVRGIAPDADFGTYMAVAHAAIAPHMTPDDVAVGQRITAAQALNAGVTTLLDNSHNARTWEHSVAAVEALVESGIRAVHAVGVPTAGEHASPFPRALPRLRDELSPRADGRVTFRLMEVFPALENWRFAAEHDLGVVAEIGAWLQNLDELFTSGLSGPDHTYNHCAGIGEDHWKAIADSGAAVNLVPRSDSHYGLGAFVPVLEADQHGIQVGLSCDNEVSYGYDPFTEMRVLQTVQRGLSFQATAVGGTDVPSPYGARDVLRAATIGGALNAGLEGQIGALEPGRKADVLVLDLDQVPTRPFGSVAGTIVNFAGVGNVEAVFVDGRVRKWDGRLVGIDYDSLAAQAERSRDRLLSSIGASLELVRQGQDLHLP